MEPGTAKVLRHLRRRFKRVVHLPQELEHMLVVDVVDEQGQEQPPVATRVGIWVNDNRHRPAVCGPSGNSLRQEMLARHRCVSAARASPGSCPQGYVSSDVFKSPRTPAPVRCVGIG